MLLKDIKVLKEEFIINGYYNTNPMVKVATIYNKDKDLCRVVILDTVTQETLYEQENLCVTRLRNIKGLKIFY